MRKALTGSRFRPLLALLIALGLVLSACGSSDDNKSSTGDTKDTKAPSGATTKVDAPGVTDTEIRFSSFGTNSNNPLGNCVLKCFDEGVKAYFDYRNSQGGIYGRKLVLAKELDDELGKNQQRALEIISAKDSFGAFSATQIASGWGDISKAGIPLYVWNIHAESKSPSIYGASAIPCFTCTARRTAYVAKLTKAKKVASLGYGVSPNSKACAQANKASIEKYSNDIGGTKFVYLNDNLAFGLQNGVAPEVSAMKKAGVDLVITCIDLKGDKTIATEMGRQGMGDVPMFHPDLYDQAFVKEAADVFEGDYVSVAFRPLENKKNASVNLFEKWMAKQGNPEQSEIAMHGWIAADIAYTGLKAAGENFDQAKVIAATNKIQNYTADGLIAPIDWDRQHEPPTEADNATHGADPDCFPILQIKNGAFALVGPADKPWLCWPGTTRDWSEPEFQDFK
jgi:ABC-type branched-subunit amino acid transport system substrate-binding protein